MFSFHKPKVYRSPTGCCICKAKSSSSRFTDSRKYEQDFLQCFQLATPRQGEICNACVLLVKRWKKLPAGSSRNWRHVVDARAGPGMKSMVKFKSKNKHLIESSTSDLVESSASLNCKKVSNKSDTQTVEEKNEESFFNSHISEKTTKRRASSPTLSDDTTSDDVSGASSRAESPSSDTEEAFVEKKKTVSSPSKRGRLKGYKKRHKSPSMSFSSFLDMSFWRRENVCCGTVFMGPNGELLIDQRFIKPCSTHLGHNSTTAIKSSESNDIASIESGMNLATQIVDGEINNRKTILKSFSDSSSDSGYDESSNPGNDNRSNDSCSSQNSPQSPLPILSCDNINTNSIIHH